MTCGAAPPPLSPHNRCRRFPDRTAIVRIVAICTAVLTPCNASATWSIVAVDRTTRAVGSAGASCTGFIAGIVAISPGHGVMVAQALSNGLARRHGLEMLARGESPAEAIKAVANREFDSRWQEQQYGAAALGFEAAGFTGASTPDSRGDLQADGVSVQGNILASPNVLPRTLAAFKSSTSTSLAERLLSALEAGAAAGGDRRCGPQKALSSYLVVARPGDDASAPSVRLVIPGQRPGGPNPVQLLRQQFERSKRGQKR